MIINTRNILITGGAGYIGSHATLLLLQAGHRVIVLDNLFNSSLIALQRITQICGYQPVFVQGDVRDTDLLARLFASNKIDAVLHFAGLKSVRESVVQPLNYYDNNFVGSLNLFKSMAAAGIFELVFSSSATVYGAPALLPISEDQNVGQITNPYGRSKLMVEEMLGDLVLADPRWRVAILRYFNPIGAHESGLIGEDSKDIPSNLLPYISQVSVGKLPELSIFGNDYPTPDGTGVRDYIHVMDLAEGHLAALNALQTISGSNVWNLGTGQGTSVLEIIQIFEAVTGRCVPYRFMPRRPGDIAICYSDPTKASRDLGWSARRSLEDMIRDAWRWQSRNPEGYN
jgi:UDP-glucose 4-epimerase